MNDQGIPAATIDWESVASPSWDCVVIGAGPAGAIAALQLARQGVRPLLVDRSRFPRWKVCGCCVNRAALGILRELQLDALEQSLSGATLQQFELASRGKLARVPMAGGIAVSRQRFDSFLIQAAIQAGATFLDETRAQLRFQDRGEQLQLARAGQEQTVKTKLVIVASGLGGQWHSSTASDTSLTNRKVSARSRVGAGATFPASAGAYADGTIHMACHASGYVGVVRLEDGQLDVAAALDVPAIKPAGGVGQLVAKILEEAGLPAIAGLQEHPWRGTTRLTQHSPQLYGKDYFLIGDAAGYVEPFTGEGMAWAIATGRAVVPFAMRALSEGTANQGPGWQRAYRQLLGRRQRRCSLVSFLLRKPTAVHLAVAALAQRPTLARRFEAALNLPYPAPIS